MRQPVTSCLRVCGLVCRLWRAGNIVHHFQKIVRHYGAQNKFLCAIPAMCAHGAYQKKPCLVLILHFLVLTLYIMSIICCSITYISVFYRLSHITLSCSVVYRAVAGVQSAVYHAGLNTTVKRKAHHDFLNDKIQVAFSW